MKKILFSAFAFILFSAAVSVAQDAETHFKAGEKKVNGGMYAEAIEDFNKALAADPKHKNSLLRRGFCLVQTQDYKGAVADYTKVIEMVPNEKFAYISRGSAKNKLEDYKGAIDDFNKALGIDPKDCEAYNNRGFAKKKLGDKDGACKDWQTSKKYGNEEAKIILKNNSCK